jgi:hypothetical protein
MPAKCCGLINVTLYGKGFHLNYPNCFAVEKNFREWQ